ncbi:MAG: PEP-CTERM sorting domain-containing protein [Luteolibacter sp.]
MIRKKTNQYSAIAASLLASTAISSAATVVVAIGDGTGEVGTQVGAGAFNGSKNGLNAEADQLWGVSNGNDVAGMLYFSYSSLAGSTLPATIQAGTYTFSARIGNDTNNFAGLNDISSSTNTDAGSVAGFFTTLATGSGGANSASATANKNNMYTEFNAVAGVTYTAPTEANPGNAAFTTWTFTWEVAEGSSVIDSDPYFGVYTRTGAAAGTNSGFWDDSDLTFDAIPEPSAFALLGLGLAGSLVRRRRI